MPVTSNAQQGGAQSAPQQQQGQSATPPQQAGGATAQKPQIRDWASF